MRSLGIHRMNDYEKDVAAARNSNIVHQALLSTGIFRKTDPNVVLAWSKQLKPVHFAPGHLLINDGGFGGCLYVLITGKVKVCHRRPQGGEIVLNILGSFDILGAITLFNSGTHSISATALTAIVAVPIECDRFCMWMAECPEISVQMLRLFARWTKTMMSCMVDYAAADVEARLASRLLFLRKRFGWQEGDAVRVVHDLTTEDLSRLVGVSSEKIGATLRNFEYRGWIQLEDNSMVIVNAQALACAAGERMEG